MLANDGETEISALVDFIEAARPVEPQQWGGWLVRPVSGGRNNLLFRVTQGAGKPGQRDLAVKLTRRDARDRAGREYHGLALLAAHAPGLAPQPCLLERDRWPQPVVVQTWMDGSPVAQLHGPPDWLHLAEYYAAVHRLRPETVDPALAAQVRPSALTFFTAREGVDYVLAELDRLPAEGRPPGLDALATRLAETPFPQWPAPARVFGRCDPNIANFLWVKTDHAMASVDWENSGWLDPAFELGDLMTHPCYRVAASGEWQHYLSCCAALHPDDPHLVTRIRAFRAILLVRWAGIFARYWYERDYPQVGQNRLVALPEDWLQSLPGEYAYYQAAAEQTLKAFPDT